MVDDLSDAKDGMYVEFKARQSPRQLGIGTWRGEIWMAEDFDVLPDETLTLFFEEAVHESGPDDLG